MAVKIVTDSTSDLPDELAQELGIAVVPIYVRFGNEVFRDGLDITDEQFYQWLTTNSVHPATVQPGPQDFLEVYQKLSPEPDGIVSIHLSSKLSGTYNSALLAKQMIASEHPIEVIDTQTVTISLGLISVAAARIAKAGGSLEDVLTEINQAISNTHLLGLLDTLKYLLLGGRIGKAKALVGSVLGIKPVLTVQDGEVTPAGQVRTRSRGVERLIDAVKNASNIQDLAIAYTTTADEAQNLAEQLSSIFTKESIKVIRIGPTLGTHLGPGALIVAFREGVERG